MLHYIGTTSTGPVHPTGVVRPAGPFYGAYSCERKLHVRHADLKIQLILVLLHVTLPTIYTFQTFSCHSLILFLSPSFC